MFVNKREYDTANIYTVNGTQRANRSSGSDYLVSKPPKLTIKQAKFVRGIAQGKTNTDSALEAYDTDSYEVAKVIASENLTKPNVQEAIEIAMVKLNITPERAIKPIDDALNDDDLEMRLKGSDRALKIMNIGKSDGNPQIQFNQIQIDQRGKYDL